MGATLMESKRIFDFDKFEGVHKPFPFWPFCIVNFHSALNFQVSVWKSEGWVNIYNVKMVKTELACDVHPLKLAKLKNPFGFNQSSHQILAGWASFVCWKHIFVKNPNIHPFASDCFGKLPTIQTVKFYNPLTCQLI